MSLGRKIARCLPLVLLAFAEAASAAPTSRLSLPRAAPAPRPHRALGLQLDAGLPDAAALGVVYRPWRPLRLSASALHNVAGFGVRGGVTVAPAWIIAPSLTLEGGHFFDANAWSTASRYGGASEDVRPLFERFGYSFASAQAGLEIGAPNRFVVFLRAGLSRVWLRARNADAAANAAIDDEGTLVTEMSDPEVRLGIPSAKLGMVLFF